MSPVLILAVTFAACLITGVPVAISMGMAALVTIVFTPSIPITHLVNTMYSAANSFTLIALPMFLLAGYIMQFGGVARRIVDFAEVAVGRIVGGLGATCTVATAIFSAVSGSGPATTAAIGSIMIPSMLRAGYKDGYAEGLAACAGGLAILIPPSIPLIIIALQLGLSIPRLFLSGVLPGLLVACFLLGTNYILAKRRNWGESSAPTARSKKSRIAEISVAAYRAKWALLAPVVVLGSIYSGLVTITEASVIAVLYALLAAIGIYKEMTWEKFVRVITSTIQVSGVVLILLTMGFGFAQLIAWFNVANMFSAWVTSVTSNPILLTLLMVAFLLFIGMWMDTIAEIFIFGPLFLPVMTGAGMDPYTYALVFIMSCEIGFDTPPVGANLFVVAEIGEHTFEQISLYAIRFVLAEVAAMLIVAFTPGLTLWLPRILMG